MGRHPPHNRTILHLDQPRSGGHLLQRLLRPQPKRHFLDHPFTQAQGGKQVQWLTAAAERWGAMDEALREQFDAEAANGIDGWTAALAETDGLLVIRDHGFDCATPETVHRVLAMVRDEASVPEEGLDVLQLPHKLSLHPNLTPLFTIRSPRLAVPSADRVLQKMGLPHGGGRANVSLATNPVWIRLLYNWYVSRGFTPVVVDCDDVQTAGSTDFLRRLCGRLALDPAAVRTRWAAVSQEEREEMHPMFYASQSTLLESEGVDARLAARNRDLDAEEEGGDVEFGEDAALVRARVAQAEVHYRWLLERVLQ